MEKIFYFVRMETPQRTFKGGPEVRITGVSETLKQELNNISDHEGTPLSSLLKPVLRKFADSYPHSSRIPVKKDKD